MCRRRKALGCYMVQFLVVFVDRSLLTPSSHSRATRERASARASGTAPSPLLCTRRWATRAATREQVPTSAMELASWSDGSSQREPSAPRRGRSSFFERRRRQQQLRVPRQLVAPAVTCRHQRPPRLLRPLHPKSKRLSSLNLRPRAHARQGLPRQQFAACAVQGLTRSSRCVGSHAFIKPKKRPPRRKPRNPPQQQRLPWLRCVPTCSEALDPGTRFFFSEISIPFFSVILSLN